MAFQISPGVNVSEIDLTAIVPEAEQAAMPPSEAFAPGSIGKKTPLSFKVSFNCSLVTFACTRQSKSASLIEIILLKF